MKTFVKALWNWLGRVFSREEPPTVKAGPEPARFVSPQDVLDAFTAGRNPFERQAPPEEWLKLVREGAPGLLIPSEEGGTPWLRSEQEAFTNAAPDAGPKAAILDSSQSPGYRSSSAPRVVNSDPPATEAPSKSQPGQGDPNTPDFSARPARAKSTPDQPRAAKTWMDAKHSDRSIESARKTEKQCSTSPLELESPNKPTTRKLPDVDREETGPVMQGAAQVEAPVERELRSSRSSIDPSPPHGAKGLPRPRLDNFHRPKLELRPATTLVPAPNTEERQRSKPETPTKWVSAPGLEALRQPGIEYQAHPQAMLPRRAQEAPRHERSETHPASATESPVAARWWSGEQEYDRWPELPPSPAAPTENAIRVLRNSDRLRANDLEQRGGR